MPLGVFLVYLELCHNYQIYLDRPWNFTKYVWLSFDKSTDRMANSVDPYQTSPI